MAWGACMQAGGLLTCRSSGCSLDRSHARCTHSSSSLARPAWKSGVCSCVRSASQIQARNTLYGARCKHLVEILVHLGCPQASVRLPVCFT